MNFKAIVRGSEDTVTCCWNIAFQPDDPGIAVTSYSSSSTNLRFFKFDSSCWWIFALLNSIKW